MVDNTTYAKTFNDKFNNILTHSNKCVIVVFKFNLCLHISCIQTLNACTKHIFIFSYVIMYIIKESHQSKHLKVLNSLILYTHTLYILRSTPGVKDASIQLFIQCFTSKKVFQGKISEVCFIQGYNKGHDKLSFIV